MPGVLPTDKKLKFPDFLILSASAGSGKTTSLVLRYLQLLCSPRVPFNRLENILAITFTNNAALQMKHRVLRELKRAYFSEAQTLAALAPLLSLDADALRQAAGNRIDELLDNYSDFNVETIDSFLTRVLKVSALELGLPPDFEIVLDSDALLDEAFAQYAQRLATEAELQGLMASLIDVLNEQQAGGKRYLWNPYELFARQTKDLYRQLSLHLGDPVSAEGQEHLNREGSAVLQIVRQIGAAAKQSGLSVTTNYSKIIDAARSGDLDGVLSKSLGQSVLKKSSDPRFNAAANAIAQLQEELGRRAALYLRLRAEQYYAPFVEAYRLLAGTIEQVRHEQSRLDLAEASRRLAIALRADLVPEIYFALGEQIHHYLIDEFQDTNPVQWAALRPLIENSLGQQGSLLLVGDTKQAIYSFRGGDWRIMMRMMKEEEFPSVRCQRKNLSTNYRSTGAVLDFAKEVFQKIVPGKEEEDIADGSGLSRFEQEVRTDMNRTGYARMISLSDEDLEQNGEAVQDALLQILQECRGRGFGYRDIAVLTPKNAHVVEVSAWLNRRGIPFLSHSSLDIRTRRITGEMMALLRFLDSPVDNLAFATVLLGTMIDARLGGGTKEQFHLFIAEERQRGDRSQPLYVRFRDRFPEVWDELFQNAFTVVGYLPVYDLVSEVFKTFRLFDTHPDEQAALIRLLGVIQEAESAGTNSLKDFLRISEESSEETSWDAALTPGEDAITVMTVHKAKGLGFPVVVALLYDGQRRSDNLFVEKTAEGIQLLRITKAEASADGRLAELYHRRQVFAQIDDLNKLYVVLTRAEKELHVISVRGGKKGSPSEWLPEGGFSLGAPQRIEQPGPTVEESMRLEPTYTRGIPPVSHVESIALGETKRGDFVHALFAGIGYVEADPGTQLDALMEALAPEVRPEFDIPTIRTRILALLEHPDFGGFFGPKDGRSVFTECDIVDKHGRLRRVDRLVVDTDEVTVIDYKTGHPSGDYAAQVRSYMEVLSDIYRGRRVRGYLAYVDANRVEEVG